MRLWITLFFALTLTAFAQRPDQLPRQFDGPPFPGSNGVVHAILNRDTTPQSYGVMFDDIFGSTAQGIPFVLLATNTYAPSALVLTAGTNVVFSTNGTALNINATLTGAGSGTVTNVAATAPAAGFTISGSPITAGGTLTFALADDLAALEGVGTTGVAQRTAANTWNTTLGTAGYLPKWAAAAPFLASTSLVFDDGSNVGISTITPSEKLQVAGNLSTYHASAASGAGYLTHSYTDTTGSTKTNIGMHGIAQYGANERKGAFQVYLSSNGPPAKVFEILNTGALGLNATLPEAVGNAIFHIANPKKSKAEADHWADVGHFTTSYAEANPISLSLGFRTSPTAANRHFFIQATELDDHPIPLILQCIGGTTGINTSNSIPIAPLTVGADTNGLGIHINAHPEGQGSGYFQFMQIGGTNLQGGIYGHTNRMTFIDSDSADVMTITNRRVAIGTLNPSAPLTVKASETAGLGLTINGRSDNAGVLSFMRADGTTLEGGIYGFTDRITMTDAASADVLTVTDGKVGIGDTTPATALQVNGVVTLGAATTLTTGTGSPESVVTAPVGSIFFRTDGGTSTTLYVKESGSGNTGWTASGGGGSSGFTNTATAVLTYGATVTPDIDAIANITRNCPRRVTLTLTLTGNVTTFNVPTATPIHGDEVKFQFIQDGTGSRTIALAAGYRTGTDITSLTLSTTASKTDWATFTYTTNSATWDLVGFVRGF